MDFHHTRQVRNERWCVVPDAPPITSRIVDDVRVAGASARTLRLHALPFITFDTMRLKHCIDGS